MLNRILIVTLVWAAGAASAASQTGQGSGSGSSRFGRGNVANLQWSTATRKEGDAQITTRTYQSLLAQGPRTLVIEEERTIQTGPNSWRTTRTTYNLDSRGRRRAVEVVEEERRTIGEEREEINRTVETPDGNGRFRLVRQEVIEAERTENNASISTTVFAPSLNGDMKAVEIIDEQEARRPSGEIENRVTTSTKRQGRWVPSEQRLKVTTTDADGRPASEWEQVFRPNSRGKLALAEQVRSRYNRAADGSEDWSVETETAPRGDGKLSLSRRVVTTLRPGADGSHEMVQEVMALRPGQRSEGLTLLERTVTSSRPVAEGEDEVTIEVQARSANGGMRQVSQSSTRVPSQEAEEKKPAEEKPPAT